MNLTAIDWAIVVAYFVLSAGVGFYFTEKGGESLSEYFLSGRNVPWLASVSWSLRRSRPTRLWWSPDW